MIGVVQHLAPAVRHTSPVVRHISPVWAVSHSSTDGIAMLQGRQHYGPGLVCSVTGRQMAVCDVTANATVALEVAMLSMPKL